MKDLEKYESIVEDVSRRRDKLEAEQKARIKKIGKLKMFTGIALLIGTNISVGIATYKSGQANPPKGSETPLAVTCDMYSASPEILNAWADYEMNKFDEAAEVANMPNSMYASYYVPVKEAYNNYAATNNETYKVELLKNAEIFQKELQDSNIGKFSFDESPYIYSTVIGEDVYLPYKEDINDGVVPDGAEKVVNNGVTRLYVPDGSSDSNSLGM